MTWAVVVVIYLVWLSYRINKLEARLERELAEYPLLEG